MLSAPHGSTSDGNFIGPIQKSLRPGTDGTEYSASRRGSRSLVYLSSIGELLNRYGSFGAFNTSQDHEILHIKNKWMNCLDLPIQVLSYQMDCSLFHLLCNISYMASCYVPQSSQWPDAETPRANMPTFFSTALTTAV